MRFPLLLLAAALHLPLLAASPVPAIADFFDNPEFSGAKLSPSGNYLAVRLGGEGKRDRLAVMTLSSGGIKAISSFSDADIGRFEWISEERLVLTAADRSAGQGETPYASGLYAINRDGSHFIQLVSRSDDTGTRTERQLLPWNTYLLERQPRQDSDSVYVVQAAASAGTLDYRELQLLNTTTGRMTPFEQPGAAIAWLLDQQGQPRLRTVVKDNVATILYRDPALNQAWRPLASFNAVTGGKGAFTPLAFGPDGTLYVSAHAGQDQSALYTYDFAGNKLADKPLMRLEGYDFHGELIMGKDKLIGVRHLTDALGTTWLDRDMQALQEHIDEILPNTVNLLTPPARAGSPWLLVEAYSDIFPSRTLLYNSATRQLTAVGASHPNIEPARMARQKLVHYQARDGLDIPAWLTVPQGAGKQLPLVMLVHGGPYARGASWGWNAEAQFLASRGYAVLQPEFRGSTGFGRRHFHAGWKQWGLKMQDDIADGARWAIAQGVADSKRICIAGASYGGYATLMGLVNDPELYRCGVNWIGVSDIQLMYQPGWFTISDASEEWKRYGMPVLIGDPVQDAAQLRATSPLLQAARIRQPLLLAYGGADVRVPLEQGSKFYQAVRQTNPKVEWIVYPEEGHGWALPKNRIDFWGRVEKFLDKNIGSGQ